MSDVMREWVEIIFNILYLITIWSVVVVMIRRKDQVSPQNQAIASRVRWAFILLAIGDTGHVGFRVVAYALGSLETKVNLLGTSVSLTGVGALATAITVTFFYMLMVDVWRLRFNKPLGWAGILLLSAGVIRLVVMALPGNNWGSTVPPQPMSLYRNLPLMVQGIGVMVLILIDAMRLKDRTFTWIGIMIAISYACYTPVILWVQQVPLIGMLMIPKTLAYLGVAFIAYNGLYPHAKTALGLAN